MCNMNKIYAILEENYDDGVLAYVNILGYVKSEEEAEKIIAELCSDDIHYQEVEPYYG